MVPNAIEGFAGVTATAARAALVTVRVVDPVTAPELAAIVVVPTPVLVASPPLEIVATPGEEELQLTALVRYCVLPSLYVPVATNCCVWPLATKGAEGVTVMLCKTAEEITVKLAEPLMAAEEACMVVFPADSPEAKPVELTIATTVLDDVQVTTFVMFDVTPLLKVPVAVNCC